MERAAAGTLYSIRLTIQDSEPGRLGGPYTVLAALRSLLAA